MKEDPSILGARRRGRTAVPRVPLVLRLGPPFRLGGVKGWWQFGPCRRLFTAADLFRAEYDAGVELVIGTDPHFWGTQEVVCYCEFLGLHSIAGVHDTDHPAWPPSRSRTTTRRTRCCST